MNIYMGGPITGLTFDEAVALRQRTLDSPLWLPHWVGLSPMRDKEQFRMEGPLPSTFDAMDDAVAQDLGDIRECDVGVWDFTGATWASIGSCCEIGYAFALGKPIVSVVTQAPHDHLFIQELSTYVCESMEEALTWVQQFEQLNTFDGEFGGSVVHVRRAA